MDVRGSPQAPQGLLGVAGIGGSSPRGQVGVGWSLVGGSAARPSSPCGGWRAGVVWQDEGAAGPGPPGSLQIVSEENAEGPPARVQNRNRGLWAQLRPPAPPQVRWHVLTGCRAQIRKLLAVAAAAARARDTGTRMEKGAEGPPPLLSSRGSQIFVVDGGTRELVVLVVVSGAWASVVRCRGSSVQGVAWAATLQSLQVPMSLSLAATWMMYSLPG